VTSHIAADPDFLDQPMSEHLKRDRILNLKRIFVHSAGTALHMKSADGYRRLIYSKGWAVFEDEADQSKYAHVPSFKPILVFGRWDPKKRAAFGDYDFLSLSEYAFFANAMDPPLVLSPKGLDSPQDLNSFGALIVTDPAYRDPASACRFLADATRRIPVLILDENRDLASCVARSADSSRLTVLHPFRSTETERSIAKDIAMEFPKGKPKVTDLIHFKRSRQVVRKYRETLAEMFRWIDERRVPLVGAPAVAGAKIGRNETRVELDRDPAEPVPVIVHQTYFPRWFASGKPVLLASPCYQLVFMDRREAVLTFRKTWVEHLAEAVSALTLLAGLAVLWRGSKFRIPRVRKDE
jgi:hypothetical protein